MFWRKGKACFEIRILNWRGGGGGERLVGFIFGRRLGFIFVSVKQPRFDKNIELHFRRYHATPERNFHVQLNNKSPIDYLILKRTILPQCV